VGVFSTWTRSEKGERSNRAPSIVAGVIIDLYVLPPAEEDRNSRGEKNLKSTGKIVFHESIRGRGDPKEGLAISWDSRREEGTLSF